MERVTKEITHEGPCKRIGHKRWELGKEEEKKVCIFFFEGRQDGRDEAVRGQPGEIVNYGLLTEYVLRTDMPGLGLGLVSGTWRMGS